MWKQFKKNQITSALAGLVSLLLFGCDGYITDKLLVFQNAVLPSSQFNLLIGRYLDDEGEEIMRIENINQRLYLHQCSEEELSSSNFIVSQVPNQDNLFVMSFPSYAEEVNNVFALFRLTNDGLNLWIVFDDEPIAEDYYPEAVDEVEGISIYPVEAVKKFLVDYGSAYIQVNDSIVTKYVDNRPLSCER